MMTLESAAIFSLLDYLRETDTDCVLLYLTFSFSDRSQQPPALSLTLKSRPFYDRYTPSAAIFNLLLSLYLIPREQESKSQVYSGAVEL